MSPVATPRMASPERMSAKRCCLRVIGAFRREDGCDEVLLNLQLLGGGLEGGKRIGLIPEMPPRFAIRRLRLVHFTQHHSGADQPLPAFDIIAVRLKPGLEAVNH